MKEDRENGRRADEDETGLHIDAIVCGEDAKEAGILQHVVQVGTHLIGKRFIMSHEDKPRLHSRHLLGSCSLAASCRFLRIGIGQLV